MGGRAPECGAFPSRGTANPQPKVYVSLLDAAPAEARNAGLLAEYNSLVKPGLIILAANRRERLCFCMALQRPGAIPVSVSMENRT